jgi:hypothetical protein
MFSAVCISGSQLLPVKLVVGSDDGSFESAEQSRESCKLLVAYQALLLIILIRARARSGLIEFLTKMRVHRGYRAKPEILLL